MEALGPGNEDGVLVPNQGNTKPTTRRYPSEEMAAAVRMVRTLRAEQTHIDYGNIAGVLAKL